MISYSAARILVEQEISQYNRENASADEEIIIDEKLTREFESGWLFIYSTRAYIERQDENYCLYGNAPIIVDREDGTLHYTGTAKTVEDYIQEYMDQKKQNAENVG